MWIALGIVGGLVLGVVWACLRVASEISRFEDWDQPIAARKRRSWK